MISATEIRKRTQPKEEIPLEDYIASRIEAAASNGYESAKMWVKHNKLDAAIAVLKEAGYKYKRVLEDINSTQLEVFW